MLCDISLSSCKKISWVSHSQYIRSLSDITSSLDSCLYAHHIRTDFVMHLLSRYIYFTQSIPLSMWVRDGEIQASHTVHFLEAPKCFARTCYFLSTHFPRLRLLIRILYPDCYLSLVILKRDYCKPRTIPSLV